MPHRRQVVCVFECRFPNDEVPFVCEGARGVRRCLWARRSRCFSHGGRRGDPCVARETAGGARKRAPRVLRQCKRSVYFELAFAKACTVRNAAWRVLSVGPEGYWTLLCTMIDEGAPAFGRATGCLKVGDASRLEAGHGPTRRLTVKNSCGRVPRPRRDDQGPFFVPLCRFAPPARDHPGSMPMPRHGSIRYERHAIAAAQKDSDPNLHAKATASPRRTAGRRRSSSRCPR